jgi:hypothetical protein
MFYWIQSRQFEPRTGRKQRHVRCNIFPLRVLLNSDVRTLGKGIVEGFLTFRYSLPNTIKLIKPTKLKWPQHVARFWRWGVSTKFTLENCNGRNHFGYLDIDVWIILSTPTGTKMWKRFGKGASSGICKKWVTYWPAGQLETIFEEILHLGVSYITSCMRELGYLRQ